MFKVVVLRGKGSRRETLFTIAFFIWLLEAALTQVVTELMVPCSVISYILTIPINIGLMQMHYGFVLYPTTQYQKQYSNEAYLLHLPLI